MYRKTAKFLCPNRYPPITKGLFSNNMKEHCVAIVPFLSLRILLVASVIKIELIAESIKTCVKI